MAFDLDSWALRYGPASVRRTALTRPSPYAAPESRSDVLLGDAEAEMLVDLWSQGTLPAYCIQQIAASSCQVASRPAMENLACIGNGGENINNCTRDLKRLLRLKDMDLPHVYLVRAPLYHSTAAPPIMKDHDVPILLPHEFMACLHNCYHAEFLRFIRGPEGALEDYWAHCSDSDPRLYQHPIKREPEYQRRAIPLRIYGDKVPFGKADGHALDVLQWSSLLGKSGHSLDCRYLIYGLPEICKGDEKPAEDIIMEAVVWSMQVLMSGVWPTKDHLGHRFPPGSWRAKQGGDGSRKLCGDYLFAWMMISGDLDWLCNGLHMTHFNAGGSMCMYCAANRSSMPWSDLRPTAEWINHLVPLRNSYVRCHRLFCSGLGLHTYSICPDILHILDLGPTQYLCASAVFMMIWDIGLPGSLDARVEYITGRLMEVYVELNVPSGERVPISRFRDIFKPHKGSRTREPLAYPFLHCKGAQGRHCVPALLLLAKRIGGESRAFAHLIACLDGLGKFYRVTLANGIHFQTEGMGLEAEASMWAFLCHYQWLAHTNLEQRRRLFFVQPKLHYAAHVGLLCKYYNPRSGWCYNDEDYNKRMALMVACTIKGLGPVRVGLSFVQKYLLRLFLRMQKRKRAEL